VVVSFQMRSGAARNTDFLFEIHGDEGDLALSAARPGQSMQRQPLHLRGGRGDDKGVADLPIPDAYRLVPPGVSSGSPYNVAQLYMRLAAALRGGPPARPSFDDAVRRHRMLDAIVTASQAGARQTVR
jgi:predicted dehydrogenase